MTEDWSLGQRTPSPATVRRMVSWVTAVTWTGAGASTSAASGLWQPETRRARARRKVEASTKRGGTEVSRRGMENGGGVVDDVASSSGLRRQRRVAVMRWIAVFFMG